MKKKLVSLFLIMSAISFAEIKSNVETMYISRENGLFYKQESSEKILLNEIAKIYSEKNSKTPIFELKFKEGKIEEIDFSNENTYFKPQNTEEKIKFSLKRMNDKNFSGYLEYSKNKSEEIKKETKTENLESSYYSSSSASSSSSYRGDFKVEKVNKFFGDFLQGKEKIFKHRKIIINKEDIDELMRKD